MVEHWNHNPKDKGSKPFFIKFMFLNSLSYFFSNIIILSCFMVIFVNNSILSTLFLVLSFIAASCLLFLFECEFIALMFVIIYVGAIAVLFLFVVMMLNVKTINLTKNNFKYLPFAFFVGVVFLIESFLIISQNFKNNSYYQKIFLNSYKNWYDNLDSLTEIEIIGQIIYTHYVLQFLVAGLILFLVVIGAVILTADFSYKNLKNQSSYKQLSRKYQNVLLI